MHISNKYVPFGRGRKIWACWKAHPKTLRGEQAEWYTKYLAWGWKHYLAYAQEEPQPWETNTQFGAYPKDNGAWAGNRFTRVKDEKRRNNKIHRQRERCLTDRYLKKGDYEDDIEGFYISTGYWD